MIHQPMSTQSNFHSIKELVVALAIAPKMSLQSSYNRDHFCLKHFLERKAFKAVDLEASPISMDAPVGPSSIWDDDEDLEFEDDSLVVRTPLDRHGLMIEELMWL